jgi:hypothetical protein
MVSAAVVAPLIWNVQVQGMTHYYPNINIERRSFLLQLKAVWILHQGNLPGALHHQFGYLAILLLAVEPKHSKEEQRIKMTERPWIKQ